MSVIKSVSVGHGDMYYIGHGSDNFTIIDCMLPTDDHTRCEGIVDELLSQSAEKNIVRFISTHPDQDHVQGLSYLDSRMNLLNFYCIDNDVSKEDPTTDFNHYCALRDDGRKAFHVFKGCSRLWMNRSNEVRGCAGINILWPDVDNPDFKAALEAAEAGGSPNNTSAIIQYSLADGVTALWMGDLETDFMESIRPHVEVSTVDILFAPHHGRESGRVPEEWLKELQPTVIVLGEAKAEDLFYYPGWNTITQNRAGDITFDCLEGCTDVYVSSETYEEDFLYDRGASADLGRYIGSFDV